MYWTYNFAPVCRKKPSHNVYEIYWVTKEEKWTFNNRCSTHHCQKGEPNLSTLNFKRDYKVNILKYPTRLPFKLLQCLIEPFSNKNNLIFDPLCGSGMVEKFFKIAKEISKIFRNIPIFWDGRKSILEMKEAGVNKWKQMEWIGWYFQFLCKNLLDDIIIPGPKYGKVEFYGFKEVPWSRLRKVEFKLEQISFIKINDNVLIKCGSFQRDFRNANGTLRKDNLEKRILFTF